MRRLFTHFCLVASSISLALLSLAAPAHSQRFQPIALGDGLKYTPNQVPVIDPTQRRLIRIHWDTPPNVTSTGPSGNPTGLGQTGGYTTWGPISRKPTNSNFPLAVTPGNSYDDADWDFNSTVEYDLPVMSSSWTSAQAANGSYYWVTLTNNITIPIIMTVEKANVTKAATVDTRIDPRFSTYQLKNYLFKNSFYKGGLFAGYNSDGAKVARTYLEFDGLPTSPRPNDHLWNLGGLSLYLTGVAQASHSAMIRARFVADNTWLPDTLVWGNAPVMKASGAEAISLPTTPQWVGLNVVSDLEQTLALNNTSLSVALSTSNESDGGTQVGFPLLANLGWAYFARPGYIQSGVTDPTPYLLYAFGGQGADISGVTVPQALDTTTNPATIKPLHSNSSLQGTVSLESLAQAGGVTVTLTSNNPAVTVPASITIPAGNSSGGFTVTSRAITQSGTVTISATLGGTKTVSISVAP